MMAKNIKTANVDKTGAANYWQRSQELFKSMRNNLMLENWNAAVIDGVHAAISANDALTVASIGKRSIGDSHMDAVQLLKQAVKIDTQVVEKRLSNIIHVKNHVEYGPSLVTSKDAYKVTQDVERFIEWAEKIYKKLI
jgi:hypothetical protein